MTFTVLDIVLFAGVSQGIFLWFSLRAIDNRNKTANHMLSLAIVFAVIMLLGRILVFRMTFTWIGYLAVLVDTTIFLFGPLFYGYTKRLIFEGTIDRNEWVLHSIPAVLHLFYAVVIIMISVVAGAPLNTYPVLRLTGFIVETLGLLSLIVYTLLCIQLIRKHRDSSRHSLSYTLHIRRYLKVLIGVMMIFALLWMISYMSSYFLRMRIPFLNYRSLWISIPLFIYVVGYFSLRQPDIFRIPMVPSIKKEKARLSPEAIKQLQKRLHYFMNEEQIYQEAALSLKSLAERLNTTSNNLSWLLNQVYQQSFYDYINSLRVKDVLHCIDLQMHEKQTLLSLAFDAGFNSKSTFNKAFKNSTGQTPSAYIKGKHVA